MNHIRKILFLLLLTCLFACTSPSQSTITPLPTTTSTVEPNYEANPTRTHLFTTEPPIIHLTPSHSTFSKHGYTHQNADGNRYIAGTGLLPLLEPIDIQLPGIAYWVVSIPWDGGSFWIVTLEDGQVLGFQVNAQEWQATDITPNKLAPGQPPILIGDSEQPSLFISPSAQASKLTHAIPVNHANISQVVIGIDGDFLRLDSNSKKLTPITADALNDARILNDEQGRLLYLSNPTEKYDHGVLGDAIEAGSITRIDDPLTGTLSTVITLPNDLVVEGVAPIWADLNGDGVREVIVTVSNAEQGAQILVLNEGGSILAAGPAIGAGYRWRHQIAVAPFGPNGEQELVEVLTPHIGGEVGFYQWKGDQLMIVAQISGFTSHVIGTRNLDMAAAGDFDGDGRVELLLPNQERSELAAIRRTKDGADLVWYMSLDARITTNLGAVTLQNSDIAIGIGLDNGILRIWHP